ncbi:MAG: hypothetical protein AAFX99_00565 [Myxococcota bacterium]
MPTSHTSKLTLILSIMLGLTMGALAMAVLDGRVFADGNPATDDVPRQIPYSGVLEVNGEPVNATGQDALSLRFTLFDGPEADALEVYSQDLSLDVFRGRFTAILGPVDRNGVTIASVVAASDALYLGMTLLGNSPGPEDDVPMANRQKLLATPFALWSSTSSTFEVGNNLNVAGDAVITGALSAPTATITNLTNTTLNTTTLTTQTIGASSAATVGGNLTVNGNVQINGNLLTWPAGSYCILRNGECPQGFTESRLSIDVGTHNHNMCPGDRIAGSSQAVDISNSNFRRCRTDFQFCCK